MNKGYLTNNCKIQRLLVTEELYGSKSYGKEEEVPCLVEEVSRIQFTQQGELKITTKEYIFIDESLDDSIKVDGRKLSTFQKYYDIRGIYSHTEVSTIC